MMASKESLKNVALGTSKINYMDPRCVFFIALFFCRIVWCFRY